MATKEAASTTREALVICMYPDICKRGDRHVAYDIVAKESDDVEHSENVKITGCWASHDGARLRTVYQDSPGDHGVKSGCVEGYARPVADTSPTVLVNGKGCVRHDTVFEMNCNGPEGPHNTLGKMAYARGGPGNVVGPDGMPMADPDPPIEGEAEHGFWSEAAREWKSQAKTAGDAIGANGKEAAAELWQGVADSSYEDMMVYGPPQLAGSGSPFASTPEGEAAAASHQASGRAAVQAWADTYERGGVMGVLGRVFAKGTTATAVGMVTKRAGGMLTKGHGGGGKGRDGVLVHAAGAPLDAKTLAVLKEKGIDPDGEVYRTVNERHLDGDRLPSHGRPMAEVRDVYSSVPNPRYEQGLARGYTPEQLASINIHPEMSPTVAAAHLPNPNGYNVAGSAAAAGSYGGAGSTTVAIRVRDLVDAGGVFYPDTGAAINNAIYVSVPPGTSVPVRIVSP
ncbi:MAG: PAAR-like domain-containing protein [Polyangiaceae bacterium]